jgi:hypothetical protein
MGGHQSTQTINVSTQVAANIVQNTAQNCIDVSYGQNTITINGDYNILSGVDQTIKLSINSNCSTFAAQNSTFSADLQNSLAQILNDQEIALIAWMDNSHDDQTTNIAQSVTANFTQSTVQNCVSNLNGGNALNVTGSGNVIKDVTQTISLNLISQCLLNNNQTNDVVNDITNTVNQSGTYTSVSPFAFIADAIAAVFKSVVVAAAIVFIVIVCFIFLFIIARGKKPPAGGTPPIIIQSAPTSAPGFGAATGYPY